MDAHHATARHRSLHLVPALAVLLVCAAGTSGARADAPAPTVLFGLPTAPLGQAFIEQNSIYNLGSNGADGLVIFSGEADAGVFFYPNTSDVIAGGDYMLAKAYGRVDGVNGYPIAIVRGRKVGEPGGFGVYPVAVDFTPLGVTNLTFQVYSGRQLVAQGTHAGGEAVVRTDFNGGTIIRVNPWWRMPDGGWGAYFEFSTSTGFEHPALGDDGPPFGEILFVRAETPAKTVAFVSRVDVTTGGGLPNGDDEESGDGLSSFRIEDLRLGKFGRAHKAMHPATLQATGGVLVVDNILADGQGSYPDKGVAVEVQAASRFDMSLLPVALGANDAGLGVNAIGNVILNGGFVSQGYHLGVAFIINRSGTFTVSGLFSNVGTNIPRARVEVFLDGSPVGISPEFEVVPTVTITGRPRVRGVGALANSIDSPPGFALRLDQPVIFTVTNDAAPLTFIGDEVRLLAVDPGYFFDGQTGYFETLSTVLLVAGNLPAFTITGETQESPALPALNIARTAGNLTLSWPDANRAFALEAAPVLQGGAFETVTAPVTHAGNHAFVTISANTGPVKFFRLRRTAGF